MHFRDLHAVHKLWALTNRRKLVTCLKVPRSGSSGGNRRANRFPALEHAISRKEKELSLGEQWDDGKLRERCKVVIENVHNNGTKIVSGGEKLFKEHVWKCCDNCFGDY